MYENRKIYSQNFLKSPHLVKKLLHQSEIHFDNKKLIIEVGPGKGIITKELLKLVSSDTKIIGVEIDSLLTVKLCEKFSHLVNVEFTNMDFMNYSLPSDHFSLVSNLPFNCTSKIMQKILDPQEQMDEALLILQKEAAEMFMGIGGNTLKSLNAYPFWDFTILDKLNRNDFTPITTVDSVLLKVTRKINPYLQANRYTDYARFIRLISKDRVCEGNWKKLFTQKQLRNLVKKGGLIMNKGIAVQKPEGILRCFGVYEDNKKDVIL